MDKDPEKEAFMAMKFREFEEQYRVYKSNQNQTVS